MYVTRLDIPWSATSFPLEGVLVKDNDDIVKLSRFTKFVYVDESKSLSAGMPNLLLSIAEKPDYFKQNIQSNSSFRPWKKFCTQRYTVNKPIAQEMANARSILKKVDESLELLRRDPQLSSIKSLQALTQTSESIAESIADNPDALVWVCKIERTRKTIFNHLVRTSIWASLMARSMGLQKSAFKVLVQAIFLSGVGKMSLRKKDWLGCKLPEMGEEYARWTQLAIERLAHSNLDSRVINTLANMNERVNGIGYPNGKVGRAIPYLAQIASLVETFDLIMWPMLSKSRKSVGQALSRLYCYRDMLFDGELIEALISAVGLYPPGTHVELSNGARGIVVEHSVERRIRGTVAVTHDEDGYRLFNYKIVRLGESDYKDVIIKKESLENDINEEDLAQINQLIASYQQGLMSKIGLSFRSIVSR